MKWLIDNKNNTKYYLLELDINMTVLKLSEDNDEKEIDFELKYLMSLTTKQRFQMMFNKQKEMIKLLKKNADRKTTEIIKRK